MPPGSSSSVSNPASWTESGTRMGSNLFRTFKMIQVTTNVAQQRAEQRKPACRRTQRCQPAESVLACRIDRGIGEDAHQDRTEEATDAVGGPHIECVVPLHVADQRDGGVADYSARKPIAREAQVGTKPAQGVTHASPATAPVKAPTMLVFRFSTTRLPAKQASRPMLQCLC